MKFANFLKVEELLNETETQNVKWNLWNLIKVSKYLNYKIFQLWEGSKWWEAGNLRRKFLWFRNKNVATYLMPVTWCVLDCVLLACGTVLFLFWRHSVTLTILFSPEPAMKRWYWRTINCLAKNDWSGDDHPNERYPTERSPLRTTSKETITGRRP
jgi:hypothetical protein